MIKLKSFDNSDWDCFAGAEGDDPKISYQKHYTVIADANGLYVSVDGAGEDGWDANFSLSCTQDLAETIARSFPARKVEIDWLLKLGFERVD